MGRSTSMRHGISYDGVHVLEISPDATVDQLLADAAVLLETAEVRSQFCPQKVIAAIGHGKRFTQRAAEILRGDL